MKRIRFIGRSGEFDEWLYLYSDECLYHKSVHDVFFMKDETQYKKIL